MTTEQRLAAIIDIPIQIKQVLINGRTINYAVAGSGPPLLLIHGANFGWGVWYKNIPELATGHTVYAIDLPGSGRSSLIDYRKLDFDSDLVEIVCEFIARPGVPNISLLGHSIGAWIAIKAAIKNPEHINKIILCDPVGFSSRATFSEKFLGSFPLAHILTKTIFRASRNNKNLENILRIPFYDRHIFIAPEFIDYYYDTMQRSHGLLFLSRILNSRKKLLLDKSEILQEKTFMVWGTYDKIVPLEKSMQRLTFFPQEHIQRIDRAGHAPFIEQPEKFNTLVLGFLSK